MSRKGFVVRIGAVFLSIFLLIFQYLDQFHLFLFKFHKNLQVNSSVLPMTLIDNSNAMYVSKLEQHDRRLIDYIRNYVMERPSEVPYSLKDPNKVHFSQANQSQFVAHFFKVKSTLSMKARLLLHSKIKHDRKIK